MATQAGGDGKDFDFDLFVIGGGTGGVRAARLSSMYGAWLDCMCVMSVRPRGKPQAKHGCRCQGCAV